jgi:nondiscriminating aspartyl-tRNA synthetase
MATTHQYREIRKLTDVDIDKPIWIEGRVDDIRNTSKILFVLLRYQTSKLQLIGFKKSNKALFEQLSKVSSESLIKVYGRLSKINTPIKSATYHDMEFHVEDFKLISSAESTPFLLQDSDSYDTGRCEVNQDLRLNNRWIDLRGSVNLSIMRIQSGISQAFRNFLIKQGFIEIHSPKTIGAASEGGCEVFELKYFDQLAYLAQSPQLYKQMVINSDFDRVFEVGPVFRAEKSFSNRHLCEFVGLDLEMAISPDKTYHEVLEKIWSLLLSIFNTLETEHSESIQTIKGKLPFELPVVPEDLLIIKFKDGVKLLRDDGKEQGEYDDLNGVNENRLGEIVKEKFGSDLFILDEYPSSVRPFYTMPKPDDEKYSHSFDIIFRGKEISSGAQRVHDYKMLVERIKKSDIDPNSLNDYITSFMYGSRPHGGCGFGLERLTMLYLNLDSIKQASLFPRDPKRLTP